MASSQRPLSPHLQIYRPQITSVLSILHRVTGVALTAGTLLLTWWLVAAASGPGPFATVQGFLGSWFGHLLLWAFTFSLFYHLSNGIRHLLWDFGWGFELEQVRLSGIAMVAAAAGLTVITLIAAYVAAGG
ncbi:MAG: succinate dehydrogenase, cytochrome b556 subunit [Rhodospirillales bacterium]|nr:MAG: succinate dehydrogenase, cytochrome b556 subunit [Rhodospirillales bacterium]TVS00198.1 MAG: succinate dehydrogenase, cytochrome b556 subunit [Rhodospirillales bacterium]